MLHDMFNDGMDDGDHANANSHGCDARKLLKPVDHRNRFGFVGLENQGATCYLNALLQVCYMTPELRYGLYSIDPSVLGAMEDGEAKVPEPEFPKKIKAKENPAMHPLVQEIVAMGFNEILARDAVQKTGGRSIEDAVMFAMDHAEDAVYQIEHSAASGARSEAREDKGEEDSNGMAKKKRQRKPRLIPLELQQLFTRLQCLDIAAVSTHELTSKGFEWQAVDGAVQHDAHELIRLLIDAIEKSLKHTPGEKLCQQLYNGNLTYETQCMTCGNRTLQREHFCDLLLPVINCENLAASLRLLTAPEVLDGANKYECEVCRSKQPARRRLVIQKLPPILTMSCQRFDIDRNTWQRVKVTTKCEFPLVVDMSHFCESSEPISQLPDIEAEKVRRLTRNMVIMDDAYSAAVEESQRVIAERGSGVTIADIPQSVEAVRRRLTLTGNADYHYELFAVVIHQGTAHSGHYSAYIRDVQGEGRWENLDTRADAEDVSDTLYARDAHGDLCVLEESPLHLIINIFQNAVACNIASGSSGGMSAKELSAVVTANVGKTWKDVHSAKHGTITAFLKKHALFFDCIGEKKFQLRDIPFRVVSSDVFAKLPANLRSPSNGARNTPSHSNNHHGVAESKDVSCLSSEYKSPKRTVQEIQGSTNTPDPRPEFDTTDFAIQSSSGQWYVLENSPLDKLLTTFNNITGEASVLSIDNRFKKIHGAIWSNSCNVEKYGTLLQFMQHMTSFFDTENNDFAVNREKMCRRINSNYEIIEPKKYYSRKEKILVRKNSTPVHHYFSPTGVLIVRDDTPLEWLCFACKKLEYSRPDLLFFSPKQILEYIRQSPEGKKRFGLAKFSWNDMSNGNENILEFMTRHDDVFEREGNGFRLQSPRYITYHKDQFESSYAETKAQDAGSAAQNNVEDDWTIVRNGKKSTAAHMDGYDTLDSQSISVPPPSEATEASLRVEDRVDMLAQELLNACFGQFYLFNDSEVRPVCITDMAKAFEGRNSAYILIYRKVNYLPVQAVPPPAYWMEKIAAQNAQLAQDRAAYEQAKRCVKVRIYLAQLHFRHDPPLLAPLDHSGIDPIVSNGLAMELVSTAPLREHFEVVLQSFESLSIDVARFLGRNVHDMKFSRLEKHGAYYYAGPELDPQTITADIAAPAEIPLLLWSRHQQRSGYITIMSSPPKAAAVMYRNYSRAIGHFEMLFASNASVKEVCETACRKAGVLFQTSMIYVLSQMPPRSKTHGHRGKLREYASSTLFQRGVIDFSWPAGLTWGAVDGHELIIDDTIAESNLAEQEAFRRNRIITIDVETDFIGNIKEVYEDLAKDNLKDAMLDGSIAIEIDYEASVNDLKQMIAKRLHFGPLLTRNIVLRLGHQRGVDILSFEMESLLTAEVYDGNTVYVEYRTERPKDTHILLRYCRVTGNDLNLIHNPKKAGVRSGMREIHADLSWTIEDVRVAMTQRVAEISGTDTEESLKNNTRLRLANDHEEAGDLLEESLQNGNLVKLKDVVGKNRLRNGSLLYLEDGKPYSLGQYHMDIYMWNPQHKATLAQDESSMKPSMEMHPNRAAKWCNLHYLGSHSISQNATLREFQERLYDMATSWKVEQITVMDSFLIRELKRDLLPGRTFWIANPKTQVQEMSKIGTGKVKPGPDSPLERHGFKNIPWVVLQQLPKPQSETGCPADGTFTIWAQRLLAVQGDPLMNPEWPPVEVKIKAGSSPSLVHLKAPLAEEFGIDLRFLRVFKYFVGAATWLELVPGMKGKKSSNKAGAIENILNSPYTLRPGDLVSAFDSRDFPEGETIVIDREEDAYERSVHPEMVVAKPEKSGRQCAEVGLKFGGDLNFSDDDSI